MSAEIAKHRSTDVPKNRSSIPGSIENRKISVLNYRSIAILVGIEYRIQPYLHAFLNLCSLISVRLTFILLSHSLSVCCLSIRFILFLDFGVLFQHFPLYFELCTVYIALSEMPSCLSELCQPVIISFQFCIHFLCLLQLSCF